MWESVRISKGGGKGGKHAGYVFQAFHRLSFAQCSEGGVDLWSVVFEEQAIFSLFFFFSIVPAESIGVRAGLDDVGTIGRLGPEVLCTTWHFEQPLTTPKAKNDDDNDSGLLGTLCNDLEQDFGTRLLPAERSPFHQ